MAAVKNLPQYPFETMSLSFFTDLSGSTLAWRRSLKPLTTLLQQRNITYRWRLNRSLLVTHNGNTHEFHNLQGAEDLLPILGLPLDAICPTTTSKPQHRWNPERVKTFVPRRSGLGSPADKPQQTNGRDCLN
ncbi:Hypothetical predicted protein [Pelobates cultripes]|uniref:Uncharacterized protein n=1 Tax=Pelobates cultripes TaxID=61616 RepID=A0AAD1T271_PELCU|nr:Hypothetical predicted protein [Pelobates cultripes]